MSIKRRLKGGLLSAVKPVNALVAAAMGFGGASLAAESEQFRLEEIVVTAEKRQQNFQDVPMALSAMSAETLRDAGVVDMNGLANMVPSLAVVQNVGAMSQSYRIRGIGSDPSTPTFEPDVALFIDGVYMPRSGLGVSDIVDLERIEVLEGPQSTLYGKNATAGVVNIVSARPSAKFGGEATLSMSDLQGGVAGFNVRTSGAMTGAVTDGVRIRMTGVYDKQSPILRNLTPGGGDANGVNRYALRGQIEFDIGDSVLVNLTGAHTQILRSPLTNPVISFGGATDPAAALEKNALLNGKFGAVTCPVNGVGSRDYCSYAANQNHGATDMAAATITADLAGNSLTSITAWSRYASEELIANAAQLSLPLVSYDDRQQGNSVSQELRLTSPSDRTVEWLAGGYFLYTDFNRGNRGQTPTFTLLPAAAYVPLQAGVLPNAIVLGQPGDLGFLNSSTASDYVAGFAQTTWHVTHELGLTGGLRWQSNAERAAMGNHFSVARNPALPASSPFAYVNVITASLTPTAVGGVPVDGTLPKQDSGAVTWTATASYHPIDGVHLYASAARGAKAGGYNVSFGNAPASTREFAPERIDDYELGAKFDLLDHRLRLGIDAFDSLYHNYQNAGFVGLQFLVNNAEEVKIQGLQFDSAYAIDRGLTLTLGANLLDARFTRYAGGACVPAIVTGVPVKGACNLSGRHLPLAPDTRFTGGLQNEHDVGFGLAYERLDATWQSAVITNTASLDPRSRQAAYGLVNARFGLRLDNGLDVSVWANNLFNRYYLQQEGALNLFSGSGGYQAFLGAPREFGLTAILRF